MDDVDTPHVLMDERMGHIDGSVSARYSRVTRDMRRRLLRVRSRELPGDLNSLIVSQNSPTGYENQSGA